MTSTKAIRQLIQDALSDNDLNILCQDDFSKVYNQFIGGQNKDQRIALLIEHVERQLEVPKLLSAIKKINPNAHAKFLLDNSPSNLDINQAESSDKQIGSSIPAYRYPQISGRDDFFDLIFRTWERNSEEFWAWGYWQDYIECGDLTLQCAIQLKKRDIEGRTLNEIGWVQMELGKFEIAQGHFSESLKIFQEIGDRLSEGQSLRYLGVLSFRRSYFGLALKYYKKSFEKTLEVQSSSLTNVEKQRLLHQQAEIHNLLGVLYFKLWNINASRREFIDGLKGFQKLQREYKSPTPSSYLYFQPTFLLNLGRVAMWKGQYRKAQRYFDRCYQSSMEIDRPDLQAGVLFRMAELARVQGQMERAEQLAKEAGETSEKEAPLLRNQSMDLRSQMRGERLHRVRALLQKAKVAMIIVTDLAINAPFMLVQSIYYLLIIVPYQKISCRLKK
jgi:tetratricopeptide (TPR) repeat protein